MFWCTARFRIRARSQGVSCAELARADPAGKASGPAAWVAPGRITHERTCRCQRLLVGRRAHLMEPGAVMTRAPVMLAADVAAIGRQEATQDAQHPTAIPKADRLAVLRHELAGGEGRASRIGKDGQSHPWRIVRPGDDRASEL